MVDIYLSDPSVKTCQGDLRLQVFEKWENTRETNLGKDLCTEGVIGKAWDPTHSCLGDSASPYCTSSGKLCGSDSYTYSCSNSDANDYDCSPGDLSGLYLGGAFSLEGVTDTNPRTQQTALPGDSTSFMILPGDYLFIHPLIYAYTQGIE